MTETANAYDLAAEFYRFRISNGPQYFLLLKYAIVLGPAKIWAIIYQRD